MSKIAAFQKTSFSNFPNDICSTVFLPGCNLRCPYCHNSWLLKWSGPSLTEQFLEFLRQKQGLITTVAISGGEPTQNQGLVPLIKDIKNTTTAIKIKIKLDTNGTNPRVIKHLINYKYVDYIAMDVKGPLRFYNKTFRYKKSAMRIYDSVDIIKKSGIKHEFRITVADPFIGKNEFIDILNITGDENLVLQPYECSGSILDENFKKENKTPTANYLNKLNTLCDNKAYVR